MEGSKRLPLIIFISLITVIFSITFISCGQPETAQQTQQEETLDDPGEQVADEEGQEQEEEVAVIEERVDYDNAEVGAELEGFIPGYLCTNKDNYIKIEITNTSDFTWKKDGENMVRIGYHYYYKQGDVESYDNPARSSLPKNVEPGETVSVDVLINNIEQEGNYIIRIDPVVEGKFWFSTKGVQMLEGEAYFGPCGE